MIEWGQGDMLRVRLDAIVNPVNCAGVMGAGLAKAIKATHPWCFTPYAKACRVGDLVPGRVIPASNPDRLGFPRWILNFPTKRHWRESSRLADVDAGLAALVELVATMGIKSVAVPPLGCGLGGLCWEDVEPLLQARLGGAPGRFVVFVHPARNDSGRSGPR
jgi:O-acetyl-ADP-ribose deacetylase (regulator of RNase III)